MAKKNKVSKKVDISKLVDSSKFTDKTITLLDKVEIIVHPFLSLRQTLTFIDNVVESCFDSETGDYLPELKDLSIGLNILMMYTNCNIPDDIEERYRLLYVINQCQDIIEVVNKNQFNDIMHIIDESIEYKKSLLANASIEKANSILNALQSANSELSSKFKEFEDMDMDKILKSLLSNGVINEEKLVNAVKQSQNKTVVNKR